MSAFYCCLCFYKIRERQTRTEMWERGDRLNLRYMGNRGGGTERAGDGQTDKRQRDRDRDTERERQRERQRERETEREREREKSNSKT